jgi:hypothetical protein
VRTNTVVGPGGDAAVLLLKGTPSAWRSSPTSTRSTAGSTRATGGAQAVAEAVRNLACVGAEPVGLTDCLNFGNPENPEVSWQFREAIRGMAAACRALEVPVVSGNVSLYNETEGRRSTRRRRWRWSGSSPTSPGCRRSWFREAGDRVVLLGEDRREHGGSAWLRLLHGIEQGRPPKVDLDREARSPSCCGCSPTTARLRTAHDLSDGGLAVALAECCFGAGLGARVDVPLTRRPTLLGDPGAGRGRLPPRPAPPPAARRRAGRRAGARDRRGRRRRRSTSASTAAAAPSTSRACTRRGRRRCRGRWGCSGRANRPAGAPAATGSRGGGAAGPSVPAFRRHPGCKLRIALLPMCGIFGIDGHEDAANLAYLGLYALQHRGQESAGIVSWDGRQMHVERGMGQVADIFGPKCSPACRPPRHRPHPLLDRRLERHRQRPADRGQDLDGAARHRPQRQPDQRRRDPQAPRGDGSIFQTTSDTEVILHLMARNPRRRGRVADGGAGPRSRAPTRCC